MTQYIKSPDMITIAPDFSGIAIDQVPAGYYRIAAAPGIGFHLVPVEPLKTIDKVYGSLLQHVPRIKQVFNERVGVPTSVILEGLKGSGKSLMMKTIAKDFVEDEGGIVLLCNQAFTGDSFFEFLQQVNQKKIVLMDEFDKVYNDKDARNNILTLLDGTFASHTLFIITMNASAGSHAGFEFFHNRPGRVFFNIKFNSVDLDAIRLYLEDHLTDQEKVAETMIFVKRFTAFNMDMLGTLVREINACPHLDLEQIGEYLNVKPDLSLDDVSFETTVIRNGLDVTKIVNAGSISDGTVRSFLKYLHNNQDHSINFMSTENSLWNTKTNKPWKHGEDVNDQENVNVVFDGKKDVMVAEFDEYLQTRDSKFHQDPKTGDITISGKDHRNEHTYELRIKTVIRKRYSFAF